MINLERVAHEELIRRTLDTSPGSLGTIMRAPDSGSVHLTVMYSYTVPTKYAKAILADYLREKAEGLASGDVKSGGRQ